VEKSAKEKRWPSIREKRDSEETDIRRNKYLKTPPITY
jgi:hypothetical protein